jgi:hypothetical protein
MPLEETCHPYFDSFALETINAKLEELSRKQEELEKSRNIVLGNTYLRCSDFVSSGKGCGSYFLINQLTYIRTHYYIEPHGCSGGDYWKIGEGKWKCPDCGHINRLYNDPDVEAVAHLFKEIIDTYP